MLACIICHFIMNDMATLIRSTTVNRSLAKCSRWKTLKIYNYGAAWLMGRRGSVMGRRGSVGSASACCKAGPSSILGSAPQGSFPHWAHKRWGYGERLQRMATDVCIVIEWMYVCYKKWKINKKEWHPATKPLKKKIYLESTIVNLADLTVKSLNYITKETSIITRSNAAGSGSAFSFDHIRTITFCNTSF